MDIDALEKKLLYALLIVVIFVVVGIIVLATTAKKSKVGLGFGLFFLLGGLVAGSVLGFLFYRARKTHEARRRYEGWQKYRKSAGYSVYE